VVELRKRGSLDFAIETVSHNYLGAIFQITGLITDDIPNLISRVFHNYEGAQIVPTIGLADETWKADLQLLDSFEGSGVLLGNRGLIGLRFEIPGGSPHYGLLDIQGISDGGDSRLIVYGGLWEDQPNTPISFDSSVPEPSTLTLLALGAVATGALVARRRAQAS